MNFYRKDPARYISIGDLHFPSKPVFLCHSVENEKFVLPGKALRVAIGLGNDRYENQTFQFSFQAFANMVIFEQTFCRVGVMVNRDRVFDSSRKLLFQVFNKFADPSRPVVVVTVANKNIVLKTRDEGGHFQR